MYVMMMMMEATGSSEKLGHIATVLQKGAKCQFELRLFVCCLQKGGKL
jgi:hypothetical protein